MDREELNALIDRHLANQGSEKDKMLLESWYLQLNEDLPLEMDPKKLIDDLNIVKADLDKKYNFPVYQPVYKKLWPYTTAAAAVIICAVGISLYTRHTNRISPVQEVSVIKAISAAGINKARLTLANGANIDLTEAKKGEIAIQTGIRISKKAEGELVYTATSLSAAPAGYNKIETPKGGNYSVHLPDGTLVRLNAASTLIYPAAFSSLKERRVELSGEAYFEVAHNKALPFRVKTKDQLVEVLGTHFNINSFMDNGGTVTTLLEGKVKIDQKTVLKPGEQAVKMDSGILVKKDIDADAALEWKNGKFNFNEAKDFKTAMYQVERWYDVKFVYPNGMIPDIELRGRLPRAPQVSKVLEGIQLMGEVHFKIEGRRIIVTK